MNWLRKLLNAPVEMPYRSAFPDIADPTQLYRARREAVMSAIDAAIIDRTGIPADIIREIPADKVQTLIALGVKLRG